jgi:hypothetical protein
MRQYDVTIYYTGFCVFRIAAKSEGDAIIKVRNIPINKMEFLSTIEHWNEADQATEIENE